MSTKMIITLALAAIAQTAMAKHDGIQPSEVCRYDANIRAAVGSCEGLTPKRLELAIERVYGGKRDSGDVCGRHPVIRDRILKTLGMHNCAEVTPAHLLMLPEFFVEGVEHNPIRSLRKITYRDLKGMKNATAIVFEFTFLDEIEPGAFRDAINATNIEISHNRMAKFASDTFCKQGEYSLPRLKTLDLDSNRPYKDSLPINLLYCMSSLERLDLDTSFLTHLSPKIFGSGTRSLTNIDLKNNTNLPESDLRALRELNNGTVSLDLGVDPADNMTDWQIPDHI